MFRVALTGGIGAGKSTVARRFAEHGAHVFDADHFARDAVAPGAPGLAAIAQRFGGEVLLPDGSLNRGVLGQIVFQDEAARSDLEAITHPEVQRIAEDAFAAVRANDPGAVIVYQIPLLVETNSQGKWDYVVAVEAPDETRVHRLMNARRMSEADARARVLSQVSNEERRRVADAVIDTGCALEETMAHTDRVWEEITRRARSEAS